VEYSSGEGVYGRRKGLSGSDMLRRQVRQSITRVFREALDETELLLLILESVGDPGVFNKEDGAAHPAEESMDGSPANDLTALRDVFSKVRSRVLSVGNNEIRRLNAIIDTLDIEYADGVQDVVFFE
jgi:hypothetical protein